MKVRLLIELEAHQAANVAQFLDGLRYSQLPAIDTVSRERLFKNLRRIASQLNTAEVIPNDQRHARSRNSVDSPERVRLVDWISGLQSDGGD